MSTTLQLAPKAADAAPRRLAGNVALVTGASSGIGEATARELNRLGASVVLVARKHDELERVVDSLRTAGGEAEFYVADVTKTVDNQQMVKTAMKRFGRLDYAVNNAGTGAVGEFLKQTIEDFDLTMNTNVGAVFLAMQAEIPAMMESGGGAIVNTASVGGIIGVPMLSAYVASKNAVVGLTKALRWNTRSKESG
jgi:NAD(P)-dependent dehydrogenase (short-subunit alcohol dehydrogenase family)